VGHARPAQSFTNPCRFASLKRNEDQKECSRVREIDMNQLSPAIETYPGHCAEFDPIARRNNGAMAMLVQAIGVMIFLMAPS
jgi:hypothetical protein